jgi:myosin heavy subunit
LLEKTRLVQQTAGERNYHIFYQLLKGASPALRGELQLQDSVEAYHYVSSSALSASIPNVCDASDWAETLACLSSIGIEESLHSSIFRLLSSILHLGNVVFQSDSTEEDQVSAATADTNAELEVAAQLLGVSADDLLTCMTKQNMYVGGATIVKVQSFSQVFTICRSLGLSFFFFFVLTLLC